MRKKLLQATIAVSVLTSILTGCARDLGSATYKSSATAGKVLEGTVISARPVTINDKDKLEDNGVGLLSGAALGGVAGSTVGKGQGQALAVVGGAIAGALAGSLAQSSLGKSQGMEYVIRLDPKYVTKNNNNVSTSNVSVGRTSVDNQITDSVAVANTQTDLISVVQAGDVVLQAGQRALIIYNNDRPRVSPAY